MSCDGSSKNTFKVRTGIQTTISAMLMGEPSLRVCMPFLFFG